VMQAEIDEPRSLMILTILSIACSACQQHPSYFLCCLFDW
jgi:hypothetical protein